MGVDGFTSRNGKVRLTKREKNQKDLEKVGKNGQYKKFLRTGWWRRNSPW